MGLAAPGMFNRAWGILFLFVLLGAPAYGKNCEDLLHNIEQEIRSRLIYTQDVFPTGPVSWNTHLGYAHHMDEHVWVIQLDLGPYQPRPFVAIIANDGSGPDLSPIFEFFEKHGLNKGFKILKKDPTYFLTQS